jgi:hypothetical protein
MKQDYKLSNHAIKMCKLRGINDSWVYNAVLNPDYRYEIDDEEVYYYKLFEDINSKFLKVVVNPLKNLIITAYFDRTFSKKIKSAR